MFYEIFRIIGLITGYPFQWLFFKKKVYYEGKKNREWKKGGKLIISNHYNLLDYVWACFLVCPRKLTAVTSEMPFKSKMVRFGMKFFGTIQANRITRNMSFVPKTAEVLKKGKLAIIYPEGRNTPDGKIHPFKLSYLLIAHQAKAPIVPVISDGNYGLFKRTRIIVGEPIDVSQFISENYDTHLPPREQLNAANDFVFNKALELREKLEEYKLKEKRKK